ncbi:hypothetical protein AB8D53_26945 [Salmonella enterica]
MILSTILSGQKKTDVNTLYFRFRMIYRRTGTGLCAVHHMLYESAVYTRVWRGTDACGNPAEAAVRHAPRSLSSTRHVKTPEDPAIRLYSSTQRATLTWNKVPSGMAMTNDLLFQNKRAGTGDIVEAILNTPEKIPGNAEE